MTLAKRPNRVIESSRIPDFVKDTLLVLPYNQHGFDLIEEHASELAGVMVGTTYHIRERDDA